MNNKDISNINSNLNTINTHTRNIDLHATRHLIDNYEHDVQLQSEENLKLKSEVELLSRQNGKLSDALSNLKSKVLQLEGEKEDLLSVHRNVNDQKGSIESKLSNMRNDLNKLIDFKQRINIQLFTTSDNIDFQTIQNKINELIECKHNNMKKIDELTGDLAFNKKQLEDKVNQLQSLSANYKHAQTGLMELKQSDQSDILQKQIDENSQLHREAVTLKRERNEFNDKIFTQEYEIKRLKQQLED